MYVLSVKNLFHITGAGAPETSSFSVFSAGCMESDLSREGNFAVSDGELSSEKLLRSMPRFYKPTVQSYDGVTSGNTDIGQSFDILSSLYIIVLWCS